MHVYTCTHTYVHPHIHVHPYKQRTRSYTVKQNKSLRNLSPVYRTLMSSTGPCGSFVNVTTKLISLWSLQVQIAWHPWLLKRRETLLQQTQFQYCLSFFRLYYNKQLITFPRQIRKDNKAYWMVSYCACFLPCWSGIRSAWGSAAVI